MKLFSFKSFNRRKTDDTAKLTRKNYGVEGKSWYNPDTDTFVPVTKEFHTREVMIHPEKFGMSEKDIHGFYANKGSKKDPEREINLYRDHSFMDWSDELVHGMHDRGWSRITHDSDKKHFYVGTNSTEHARKVITNLINKGHATPEHSFTAHIYDYGKEGYGGKVYKMTHEQAQKYI